MAISDLKSRISGLELKSFIPATAVFAAWIITGLTLTGTFDLHLTALYSGLTLILIGALAFFWKNLDSPAGETWTNIISAGIFINLSVAALVFMEAYSSFLIDLSILYWMAVPGYGLMVNANFLEEHSRRYALLAQVSSIGTITYLLGLFQFVDSLVLLSISAIGLSHGIASYTALERYFN